MPIPLPNLDDRTYAELAAEAQALIPHLQPEWTDHNPSDPGMVLVELLAWLTEMLLFQVNEIPDASTERFLQLLNGRDWSRPPGMSLDDATLQTMRDLRTLYRAVTAADYEHLTRVTWPSTEAAVALGPAGTIARMRAVPRRNLAATDPTARGEPAPAHVSLVVVPQPAAGEHHPRPTPELLSGLTAFLGPRRMLTTRLHVVGPSYVDVGVIASLALHEDAPPAEAFAEAHATLAAFFDPLTGGPDGTGWPFGRDAYASEAYAVLEQVSLVNYIEALALTGPVPITASGGDVIGVKLDAHELVRLTTVDLVAYDVFGKRYTSNGGRS